MKKLIALLLALLLPVCLIACAPQEPGENPPANSDPNQNQVGDGFYFTYEGVKLVPGAAFDPSVLPEADYVYTVPSCAIEGTDNVYSYPVLELTAYNDGTGEVIYSIYLTDADTPTEEGLYVGDDLARVTELYGETYSQNDSELIFTKGNTSLCLILNGDTVISIEYRMVV